MGIRLPQPTAWQPMLFGRLWLRLPHFTGSILSPRVLHRAFRPFVRSRLRFFGPAPRDRSFEPPFSYRDMGFVRQMGKVKTSLNSICIAGALAAALFASADEVIAQSPVVEP